MVESAIRENNWRMGAESIRRKHKAKNNGCLFITSKNRHKMVSRILQAWKDRIYPWTAEVWEKQKLRSISVNGCCV